MVAVLSGHGLLIQLDITLVTLHLAPRAPEGASMLERITKLVNDVIATVEGATPLAGKDIIELIGELQCVAHSPTESSSNTAGV